MAVPLFHIQETCLILVVNIFGLADKLRKIQKETNEKLTHLIQESGSSEVIEDLEELEDEEEEEEPAKKILKL